MRHSVSLHDEAIPHDPLRDLARVFGDALACPFDPGELDTRNVLDRTERRGAGLLTFTRRHPMPDPYAGGSRTEVELWWRGDDGASFAVVLYEDVWGGWGGWCEARGDAVWSASVRDVWLRWCEGRERRAG